MIKKLPKKCENLTYSIMIFLMVFGAFAQKTPQKIYSEKELISLADRYIKTPIKRIKNSNGDEMVQRNLDTYLMDMSIISKNPKTNAHHKHDEELECSHNSHLLRDWLKKSQPSVSTMTKYFKSASTEFKVPVEILMAAGQVQSNWVQVPGSFYGSWGVMGLIENDRNNQIAQAAKMLKVTSEAIKTDPRTNIRAAAALLQFYQTDKSAKDLGAWFEATRQLTGLSDEAMKTALAERFYKIIKNGSKSISLWKEIITIDPSNYSEVLVQKSITNSSSKTAKSAATNAVDYPTAKNRITSCNYGVGRNGYGVDYYFVHYMATGTYEGAISWFNDCSRTTPSSAHYCIRNSDGEISQVVRDADRSYSQGVSGQPQWNGAGISTEHEVLATNLAMWDSQAMLNAAGALGKYICDKYGISKSRRVTNGNRAIYGHNDVNTSTDCPNLTSARWSVLLDKISGGGSNYTPNPTAPTNNQLYVNNPVNFTWTSTVTNADYRLQVSKSNTGWTDTNGFTSNSTPNSSVIVNTVINTSTNFTWNTVNSQVSELAQGGTTYYYTIRSYSVATGTSKYTSPIAFTPKSINCTLPATTSKIVDNPNATTTGTWLTSTSTSGYEGVNYIHDNNANKGTNSVTYSANLPQNGKYEVFVKHTAGTNRASNVPIDVVHESGTTTITVNQQLNNGVWISLGKYNFSASANDKVVIRTTGTNGVVIADAVRFVFIDCTTPANPNPIANFTSTPASICAGQTVTYTNTSTNATSYNWTFPGGSPATSTAQNPVVTYTNAGTYDATLEAINGSGSNIKTTTSAVTVNPSSPVTAGFTSPFVEVATGENITLTNTSTGATSYSWTFPNGSPATSTAANPTVNFTTTGSKTITLVASNSCGSSTFTMTICVGTNTKTTLETFEASAGRFNQAPTTSGSTVGIATTSTLARATDSFKSGTASLKAVLNDNTASTSNWTVRLLSGGGTPANNQAFTGNQGTFGFWMRTSTANAGATVTAWIDDADGLEELPPIAIINNGAWNYYSWFLPTAVGTNITTGNGIVSGASVTLDAIVIKQNNTANTMTVWIDDIEHTYIASCSGTRKSIDATKIEDIQAVSEIQVYPNPSNGVVTISRNTDQATTLSIVNILGQEVKSEVLNTQEHEINLNHLPNGMYFLNFVTDNERVTKKIIIQK